jgi:lysozyme
MTLTPSQVCIELIKESEGLHRKLPNGDIQAYADPVGIFTIGYGSIFDIDKNRPVQDGDIITQADAERWLLAEIDEKMQAVNTFCKVVLTQGMFDSLVSFTFNFGIKAFKESTLLQLLNDGKYEKAAQQFDRWIHGDGKILPGLVIRRDREEALFRQDQFPSDNSGIAVVDAPFPDTDWIAPKLPLEITRTLVEGNQGEDCFILNCALAKLGYLAADSQPGKYTSVTRAAVEWFQGENGLKVDGKFGPKTKIALAKKISGNRLPAPMSERVYCRLTRTGTTAYANLEKLSLEFVNPKGRVLEKMDVVSGVPSGQEFRTVDDPLSFAGNLEPIPQARYIIGDIDFAGGARSDDFVTPHAHPNNGIGPVFVPLIKTQIDDRDDFGFHMDWNKDDGFPGSAGCVCVETEDDLRRLVALLRLYDPRDLFVDWGIR